MHCRGTRYPSHVRVDRKPITTIAAVSVISNSKSQPPATQTVVINK